MLADHRCRAAGNTHRVGGLNHCTMVGGLMEICLLISLQGAAGDCPNSFCGGRGGSDLPVSEGDFVDVSRCLTRDLTTDCKG